MGAANERSEKDGYISFQMENGVKIWAVNLIGDENEPV
jgi:hypothetical protein